MACHSASVTTLGRHGTAPGIRVGAGMREQSACTLRLPLFARCSKAKGPAMARLQAFTQPVRLSPSSRNDGSSSTLQNMTASDALFLIQLNTSKHERSGLSDPEAGVMISLIAEDGNALLQRISASDAGSGASEGSKTQFLFQTGSQDIVKLHGSRLGRLGAVWVGPESGTWRVESIIVAEIPWNEQNLNAVHSMEGRDGLHSLLDGMGSETLTGLLHRFHENEEPVGDKCCSPAVEFKPCAVHDFYDGTNLKAQWIQDAEDAQLVKEEVRKASMQEYSSLKTSLLSRSALLVAFGTILLVSLDFQQGAESFAIGGLGGFFYLLLLQRAVDRIPGPDSASVADQVEHTVRDVSTEARRSPKFNFPFHTLDLFLSPLVRIPLVASFTLGLARTILGSSVSPQELLVGIAGFLISVKLSIFVAAVTDTGSAANKR